MPKDERAEMKWPDNEEAMVADAAIEALRAFVDLELDALVRKVIHRLQRFPATGLYGDGYAYKTLWDEYCHEVQEGPFDIPVVAGVSLEEGWRITLHQFVIPLIDELPRHWAGLLWAGVLTELIRTTDVDHSLLGGVSVEGIGEQVIERLQSKAQTRNIDRFREWEDE